MPSIHDEGVGDEALAFINRLTGLEEIDLSDCSLTDAVAQHLNALRNLNTITLSANRTIDKGFGIGDEAVKVLAKLPQLKELTANHTKITDKGLKLLAKNPSLRRLSLSDTQITDEGISELANTNLEALYIGRSVSMRRIADEPRSITDKSLQAIGTLDELQQLSLTGTHTSDEGLKQIANLPKLTSLTLDDTLVTNAGIQQLGGLEELKFLRISPGVKLNNDSLRALRGCTKLKQYVGTIDFDENTLDQLVNLPALEDLRVSGPLKGKVVLIDFWGTWCGPCVAAMPKLKELRQKHGDRGFEIIAIHTTAGSENFQGFVDKNKYDWIMAVDDENKMEKQMKPSAYPSYSLVDRQGVLRISEVHQADLEKAVKWLVEEE